MMLVFFNNLDRRLATDGQPSDLDFRGGVATHPLDKGTQFLPALCHLLYRSGTVKPPGLAQVDSGREGFVLEKLRPGMVLVEAPRHSLQAFALHREARRLDLAHDLLQGLAAGGVVHGAAKAGQLGRRWVWQPPPMRRPSALIWR